jgi:hypothetical protein
VPLLVAVVIMASLGWVILARGTSPADGTVTFPSAPYWSERGVVINDVVPGISELRVGDCVVAVDGRPVEDVVRNGPVRNYRVGDVIRYDVRRSDATLRPRLLGQLASIEVTLSSYRFGSVLREHASVLLLPASCSPWAPSWLLCGRGRAAHGPCWRLVVCICSAERCGLSAFRLSTWLAVHGCGRL